MIFNSFLSDKFFYNILLFLATHIDTKAENELIFICKCIKIHKRCGVEREEAICELIKKERITDQKMLAERLKSVFGIQTNQVTVSRDLRKLGVSKKIVQGQSVYELPEKDVRLELLSLAFLSIAHNGMMIVIKTHPGLAAFVGDCLDQEEDLGVLGCLAGENVVFVVPGKGVDIESVCMKICERFGVKQ
jgi:transcriptional regulator of arginine metabolism